MSNSPKIIKISNVASQSTILEELMKISSKMIENHAEILNKLDSLEKRIVNVEKKIELTSKEDYTVEDLIELKREKINVTKNDALKALSYRDYRAVLYIFRQFYKNKTNIKYSYPIRITGKRSFDYYANNKWNNDLYGHTSMNIICENIQNLFIKFNDLDNGDVSDEDFMNNQQFICKLSDEKYRKDIYKNIIEEVRINNI